MRVLVAGATGYLGGHVCREFQRRHHIVRALVRKREQQAVVREFADEVVIGQVTSPETVRDTMSQVDAVFSSIGITRQRDGLTYEDVDYRGNLNLLEEALRARVRRFVYVSIFRGRELRQVRLIAAKERFVDALQAAAAAAGAGSIESCIVRPTGFFSDMADILRMARRGVVLLLRDGKARINPVSGRDVAISCVDAVVAGHHEAPIEVEVGGPDVFSYNDIAALAARVLGKRARVWHVPAPVVGVMRAAAGVLAPAAVAGALEFVDAMSGHDMVAPVGGADQLDQFFASVARAGT
jgi:uncharacterized protein YbjT (DUF2867 family)